MTDDEKREQLRRWLDRRQSLVSAIGDVLPRRWRDWFDADGEYLGQRSARTGPDVVTVDEAKRRER